MLSPRFTITLPPVGLLCPYTPFEEFIGLISFYFVDYDLKRLVFVLFKSSCFTTLSLLIESNPVMLNEFLEGRFTLRLELGRTLISGKNPYPDLIKGSEGLLYSSGVF